MNGDHACDRQLKAFQTLIIQTKSKTLAVRLVVNLTYAATKRSS